MDKKEFLKKVKFRADVPIVPWWYIRDYMQELWIDEEELSDKLWMDVKGLLKWEKIITEEIANKLEEVFDVPSYVWIRFQRLYDDDKKRLGI